jgi:signal peptidase I
MDVNSSAVTAAASQAAAKPRKSAFAGFSFSVLALLALALFCFFSFRTVIVSGYSMLPTFHSGQRLLACRAYWLVGPIKDNDVVVIQMGKPGDYIIKRVYRTAGETVEWYNSPSHWNIQEGEYKVPDGEIFVLGDNRPVSEDSRAFGSVPVDHVIGKILRL